MPEAPTTTFLTTRVDEILCGCMPIWPMGNEHVGAFSLNTTQKKFSMVVVDYFFKWVEVRPLVHIAEEAIMKFLW